MRGRGYPRLTLTWTAGHFPGVGGADEVNPTAGEQALRDFAAKLRAIPEIDDVPETRVQIGPPGPDEAPRIVGYVDIYFDGHPTLIIEPFPGYRRSEMAELAADVIASGRKLRLAHGLTGLWG